jgi:hypothetical protein
MLGLNDIDTNDLYISECCFASSIGELDMSTVAYGGPSGFCGRCHDNCIFVLEDIGEPFDTNEEKWGER